MLFMRIEVKASTLGLDPALIKKHGAVSRAVAAAMAGAVRARTEATYGLATTGIAGPTGGSARKPVGTVYIGLASNRGETWLGISTSRAIVRPSNKWRARQR